MRHLVLSPVNMLNYRVFTNGNSQDREETPKQKEAEKLEFDAWLSPDNSAVSRVDVRSEVARGSNRPNQTDDWEKRNGASQDTGRLGHITQHHRDSSRTLRDFGLKHSRWSDGNSALGLSKKVLIKEEEAQQRSRSKTGRQVAWMVFDHFKYSDTDGTVLDLSDR